MIFDPAASPGRLAALRDALLADYQPEDLHQLRVLLRRIRSELRHLEGDEAADLQRAFGALARSTNAARDWDTLAGSARAHLHRAQFDQLGPLLENQQADAHDEVYRMLHSLQWRSTMQRWQDFLDSTAAAARLRDLAQNALQRAVERVDKVSHRALAEDSVKHWHKLRIAIKELRYTLDSLEAGQVGPPAQRLIEQCKVLQALLGEWHDTVVHGQLLEGQFADALKYPDTPVNRAASALYAILQERGRQTLEQVRPLLAGGFPGHRHRGGV